MSEQSERPPMPSSPVAQAAQAAQTEAWDVRVTGGVKLSRFNGKVDFVPTAFPALRSRVLVHKAFMRACGFLEGDESEPSGAYNDWDVTACTWAALGLCWRGPDVQLPDFRDMARDVVAYGEAVNTQLVLAGYGDSIEQAKAGAMLMQAFVAEVNEAASRAAAGFPKAKGRT